MRLGTKKLSLIILLVGYCNLLSSAQNFANTEFPLGHEADYLDLADLDQDGQLELLMIVSSEPLVSKILIYDLLPIPELVGEYSLNSIDDPVIRCRDLNNDGKLEIMISGSLAGEAYIEILTHAGNYTFQPLFNEVPQLLSPFQLFDVNQDGRLDLLGKTDSSPDSINHLYLNTETGIEKCSDCLFNFPGLPIGTIDIDNDGFLDLISSNESNLELIKDIGLTDTLRMSISEQFIGPNLAFGDIDQDGADEILISRVFNSDTIIDVLEPDSASFRSISMIEPEELPEFFRLADLTNNGYLELLSQENNTLKIYSLDSLASPDKIYFTENVIVNKFTIGDIDADLDLDIVLTGLVNNQKVIWLLTNNNETNLAPSNPAPVELFSLPRGDSVQFLWSSGADDTTPIQSLTYELLVYDNSGTSALPIHLNNYRSIPASGAQLHTQVYYLKNLAEGRYRWAVQSIDNSFAVQRNIGFGDCMAEFGIDPNGTGPNGIGQPDYNSYDLCPGDTIDIALASGETSVWYSMNDGLLDNTDVLSYVAGENDAIYTNYFLEEGVTATYVVYINVREGYEFDLEDFNGCFGDRIYYALDGEFTEANWQFLVSGELYQASLIDIQATVSDTIVVAVATDFGCISRDTIVIEVSPIPDIEAGDDITIEINESVVLSATGAETYLWSPIIGLNDPTSAAPIANPSSTTIYTVTGYSENNCSNTDSVTVIVENTVTDKNPDIDENPESDKKRAFVPNLFSPNGDGNNDSFKVYANNIASATLKVFNSAGQEVFSGEITSSGSVAWDGTYNGSPSPQGNYVWSLSGQYNDGTRFEEIGPTRGTVTLIR